MTLNRRQALILATAASAMGLAGVGPASAADGDRVDQNALLETPEGWTDTIVGNPEAKVTVIEYASPTCVHCASFHVSVFPAIREKYIDTDQVRFILRPYLRNELDAVVFLLAQTAGPDYYSDILSAYLGTQQVWTEQGRQRTEILNIAKQFGFTEETFDAALTNQDLFTAIQQTSNQAVDFGLTGTPTFFINGKLRSGALNLEQMSEEIDPLL